MAGRRSRARRLGTFLAAAFALLWVAFQAVGQSDAVATQLRSWGLSTLADRLPWLLGIGLVLALMLLLASLFIPEDEPVAAVEAPVAPHTGASVNTVGDNSPAFGAVAGTVITSPSGPVIVQGADQQPIDHQALPGRMAWLERRLFDFEKLERDCVTDRGSDEIQRRSTQLYNDVARYFEHEFGAGYMGLLKTASPTNITVPDEYPSAKAGLLHIIRGRKQYLRQLLETLTSRL